ncbi:helix-turn-helix transcriptional regulator [Pseudomonas aeruginosa]
MSLTKFGTAVREYRRQLGLTLSSMATALSTSPAFLSAMETGRSKVPMEWVEKIASYFVAQGKDVQLNRLKAMACESNGHCCKVSDEAAFCLIQRPYISKTLLTRRISPRGSP